jgi:hypothetical protein
MKINFIIFFKIKNFSKQINDIIKNYNIKIKTFEIV